MTSLAPDRSTHALEDRVALIACGERPGKTQACARCRRKGEMLLNIASTGATDALAAAICGTGKPPSCGDCAAKARQIVRVYGEEGPR
ncbi:hypothetical protein HHL19_35625 [Streptomyces sp. R302]|uniref:hypothetical protein n=1 Tax=unclassified Streptomyces TaxID=2593676 RepID=UPI00145DFA35|nr:MULTISPECIES: hypothetical protein [unclassified Streptomyces]NML55129.1 hypothetical protein [Streptomyces sp. R301]NML83841.1 hypothetical protein [Streptomyces sp. R302]